MALTQDERERFAAVDQLLRETRETMVAMNEALAGVNRALERMESIPAQVAVLKANQDSCPARRRRWSTIAGLAMTAGSLVASVLVAAYTVGIAKGLEKAVMERAAAAAAEPRHHDYTAGMHPGN